MTEFRDPTPDVIRHVRDLRKARGMSAQMLSDRCQAVGVPITRSSLANMENGRRQSVTIDELFAFAHVLGVSIAVLTGPDEICARCHGRPPAGWICGLCGAGGDQ